MSKKVLIYFVEVLYVGVVVWHQEFDIEIVLSSEKLDELFGCFLFVILHVLFKFF